MEFTLRPMAEIDLAPLYELYRRIEIYDQIPIVTPWEEIEELANDPNLDLARDGRLAMVGDRAVGFCYVMSRPGESDHIRAYLVGGVEGAYRRQGIGSALLRWELDRGRELLKQASSDLPRFLRTFAFDFETEAIALYEKHGLKPIRYFSELIRPLPAAGTIPEIPGIVTAPWADDRSEEVRQLMNLAFRDHWGSTPRDEATWEHQMKNVGIRRDLSLLALAVDQVVGASINYHYPSDVEVTGRREGWIGQLGTHPNYRRRGIASALIERSCNRFYESGFDHAMIGVDSESLTGANRLYQNLGFRPLHRQIQHQIGV